MPGAVFQHVRVLGKNFERSSVVLDSRWFENCSFKDCEVFYSGGLTEARSCRFDNIRASQRGCSFLVGNEPSTQNLLQRGALL
jgi:hypothetical protein